MLVSFGLDNLMALRITTEEVGIKSKVVNDIEKEEKSPLKSNEWYLCNEMHLYEAI